MENHQPQRRVTKSNKLIEASYRLSISEQRIIALVTSLISPDDEDFKPYVIPISQLEEMTESEQNHRRIEQITEGLSEKVLQIREPDGLLQVSWLSSAKYHDGRGEVELEFSPKLKPYLLQLKERFTSYGLRNIVRLQSRYSVRLYELCKQYESLGKRTFELPELREALALGQGEYARWQDFRRWVLAPALKELPVKTDIRISYTTRKRGRKVWYIDFTIQPTNRDSRTLSSKQTAKIKSEATKCWNRCAGSCAGNWENHNDPGDSCYWCRKFDARRAEDAGQVRLFD